MRLLILSDLHLKMGVPLSVPIEAEYDVVLLAGDIHSPWSGAIEWARMLDAFGGKPVVPVPGNHEFYGCVMDIELGNMRRAAVDSNMHVLARDTTIAEGLRVVVCTLWTDFQLAIRQADGSSSANVDTALKEASECLNAFRQIEIQSSVKGRGRQRQLDRLLGAEDTLAMHWIDRDWLRRTLAEPFCGPTVVVTHHALSKGSVAARYAMNWLTPAFVSDLSPEFFEVPALWVHGHTHTALDYREGACRVVSNPRGYSLRRGSFENPSFSAGLVVDIPVELWTQGEPVSLLRSTSDR